MANLIFIMNWRANAEFNLRKFPRNEAAAQYHMPFILLEKTLKQNRDTADEMWPCCSCICIPVSEGQNFSSGAKLLSLDSGAMAYAYFPHGHLSAQIC